MSARALEMWSAISIHALREEGDQAARATAQAKKEFLSTPSARRATNPELLFTRPRRNFYPRPPRGGRLPFTVAVAGS